MNEWKYLLYLARTKRCGIDLELANLDEIGLSSERSKFYSNSGGPDLAAVLHSLPIAPGDSILDLGCGKGGAMITMAELPFARVDGVELCCELAVIAERNFKKAGTDNACVYCGDAADFTALEQYKYVYMYNPFPEVVMKGVLDNIRASVRKRLGELTLIYRHPIYDDLLQRAGFARTSEFHFHPISFPEAIAADRTFYVYKIGP